jgi:hypothetical protein
MFHKTAIATILAGLLTLPVEAAPGADQGSLPPGKPAGVSQAQLDPETFAVVAGGAVLFIGFAVVFLHEGFSVTSSGVNLGGNNDLGVTGVASTVTSTATR